MFDKKNTRKVLAFLFRNPRGSSHLREMSRKLDVSVSSISTAVDELDGEDLVKIDEGVTKQVSANLSEKFRDLKRAYNLKELASSGLIEKVEKNFRPDCIVLFGSYSKGEDDSESDIDIAIINGRDKEMEVSNFEGKLERNINLHKVSLEDLEGNFKKTLANGIVLRGYLDI